MPSSLIKHSAFFFVILFVFFLPHPYGSYLQGHSVGLKERVTRVPPIYTRADYAVLIDGTGRLLFQRNAQRRMYPASLSKIMTLYLIFERLAEGRLRLDDTIRISDNAWRQKGSRMFLSARSVETVHNLLRGIIVHSGNDACVAMAEAI